MQHSARRSEAAARTGADCGLPEEPLLRVSDGAVAYLTLNRPGLRNALNRQLLVSLGAALSTLQADAATRVVVLSGAGASFCAGVDISDEGRRTFYQQPQPIERLYQEHGQSVVRLLQSLPQVTIAAVNGPAVGWGVCLATCCDFRLAAADAFFRIPEIGLGMHYDVGCLYGLLALVGPAEAKRMTMLGVDVSAVEAERIGLADAIVPAADLPVATGRLISRLLSRDVATLRVAKRQIYAATVACSRHLAMLEVELATLYYGSNWDRFEALTARRDRRAPQFSAEQ